MRARQRDPHLRGRRRVRHQRLRGGLRRLRHGSRDRVRGGARSRSRQLRCVRSRLLHDGGPVATMLGGNLRDQLQAGLRQLYAPILGPRRRLRNARQSRRSQLRRLQQRLYVAGGRLHLFSRASRTNAHAPAIPHAIGRRPPMVPAHWGPGSARAGAPSATPVKRVVRGADRAAGPTCARVAMARRADHGRLAASPLAGANRSTPTPRIAALAVERAPSASSVPMEGAFAPPIRSATRALLAFAPEGSALAAWGSVP